MSNNTQKWKNMFQNGIQNGKIDADRTECGIHLYYLRNKIFLCNIMKNIYFNSKKHSCECFWNMIFTLIIFIIISFRRLSYDRSTSI